MAWEPISLVKTSIWQSKRAWAKRTSGWNGPLFRLSYIGWFDSQWVKCISSVQYQVLLNGQPRSLIIPHRSLRQGDSLSPYLFIMYTETLIANIKKAEREKQLTGMKVARACPSISHLLFADENLFFCKAQKEECQTILRILKWYEVVVN